MKDGADYSIQSVSYLSCLRARQLLRDVAADAGILRDKATVLGDMTERTHRVMTDAKEIG